MKTLELSPQQKLLKNGNSLRLKLMDMPCVSLNTKGIIQLGVIALIATPILRIASSLVAFFVEKDKLYIVITFIVLSVMLLSLLRGLKA